jgi:hypothetical protein
VLSITKHAKLHLRARDMRELDGATETLVFLGIIVLQSDLELYGLREVTLLLLRVVHHLRDYLPQCIALKLTVQRLKKKLHIYKI